MFTTAALITWPNVYKTDTVKSMIDACLEFDIILNAVPLYEGITGKEHFELISKYKNVISWVCFSASDDLVKKDRNYLFFENGIIMRGKTFYLDDNGYGVNSNIVTRGYNKQKYCKKYIYEVYDSLKQLGWKIGTGFYKNGPILIGLQARPQEDLKLLMKCKKYLPKNAKIIVRSHPKNRNKECSDFCESCGWEQDDISDPFMSLSRSRALVVNSSSIMYKALAMEIPVATCDRGFHSGTAAVLDCSRNPDLLSFIFDFRFELECSQNLICSLHDNSISSNIKKSNDLLINTNFANWLKKIIVS
jgi:hypothetical protein